MGLWQKSFLLEEDDDELEMAYYMVCLQPKRPVYHGQFSMDDFCESEFLANFRFAKREREKEDKTTPFTFNSIKKKKKSKTFDTIY